MGTLVPLLALLFLSCLAPAHQQSDEETVSLPLTPPIASVEVVEQNDATCPSSEAQNVVNDALQPMILSTIDTVAPCTQRVKGLVSHCPASNCTELFNLAQEEGVILLSGYYWLVWANGEVRKVYCNRDTQQPEYSPCEAFLELDDLSGVYTVRSPGGSPVTVYCNSETGETEYFSCADVYQLQPNLPSGVYTIRLSEDSPVNVLCNNETGQTENLTSCAHAHSLNPDLPSGMYLIQSSEGNPVTVYCDMDSEGCGGGGWTRVASYDYSDPNTTCPSAWSTVQANSIKACSLPSLGCFSSSFPTPVEFNEVCGRVIGIQRDTPDAFAGPDDINGNYVEGVSITHGSPRQHIWSFAAFPFGEETVLSFLCPCSNPSLNVPPPPSFVGNNYFCDTAILGWLEGDIWHTGNLLWDGQGCYSPSTCCSFNNPPWFSTTLPQNTTDDVDVRICHSSISTGDDITAIVQLDLYIR